MGISILAWLSSRDPHIVTGSKLSICSHPGKITGYWITTRSFPYRGPYWPGTSSQANMGVSLLIHGHFHIGLVIIPRPPYWPETESRANMGRGMITRPIWKCPCIKLFITYFRHLEKRHPITWAFPYWPGYHPSSHIGPQLRLGPIWGSRDDNQVNMKMSMY
jgi:hypothetical protein